MTKKKEHKPYRVQANMGENALAACEMYTEMIRDLEAIIQEQSVSLQEALKQNETMMVALVSIEHDNWCKHFNEQGGPPYGKTCPTCICRAALQECEANHHNAASH